MKPLIVAALTLLTAGCGLEKADEFRNGYPKGDAVTMKLPGSTGALSGDRTRQGLEGEKAALYTLTRGVTYVVNGGGVWVLALVKAIGEQTPTTVTGNKATWGPHTEALSPNTYKFTVTRNRADDYSYALEAKAKTEADTAFRVILSGSHLVTGKDLGSGTFLLDWDKIATLPEHDDNVGSAEYSYSRTSATSPIKIDAIFRQVLDRDTNKKIDVDYKYVANPGNGGNFEFKMSKDLAPGTALESSAVKSRWQENGAGRSDVKVIGGNLTSEATFSECWDSNFASRYLVASFAPTSGWGAESACAFQTAEYSVVAP
ncbi:MAG: hypothetical protein H6Q89_4845 [Myxococcaceae bacterium]|nr:hypothetical protein [Myxococcaceae bacterium]